MALTRLLRWSEVTRDCSPWRTGSDQLDPLGSTGVTAMDGRGSEAAPGRGSSDLERIANCLSLGEGVRSGMMISRGGQHPAHPRSILWLDSLC
jgi:hypothetical protein